MGFFSLELFNWWTARDHGSNPLLIFWMGLSDPKSTQGGALTTVTTCYNPQLPSRIQRYRGWTLKISASKWACFLRGPSEFEMNCASSTRVNTERPRAPRLPDAPSLRAPMGTETRCIKLNSKSPGFQGTAETSRKHQNSPTEESLLVPDVPFSPGINIKYSSKLNLRHLKTLHESRVKVAAPGCAARGELLLWAGSGCPLMQLSASMTAIFGPLWLMVKSPPKVYLNLWSQSEFGVVIPNKFLLWGTCRKKRKEVPIGPPNTSNRIKVPHLPQENVAPVWGHSPNFWGIPSETTNHLTDCVGKPHWSLKHTSWAERANMETGHPLRYLRRVWKWESAYG